MERRHPLTRLRPACDPGTHRAPRPRHHFPTCRGGGHRPHGQGHPDCDPPPPSATFMCVTVILTQTEQKRQDRSVHRAEKRRHRARMMRVFGPIRPNSSVWAHASAVHGPKRLISSRNQAMLTSNGRPPGECRLLTQRQLICFQRCQGPRAPLNRRRFAWDFFRNSQAPSPIRLCGGLPSEPSDDLRW
jgi:hypothetical protein